MKHINLLLLFCFCFVACKQKMEPDAINPSVMLWYNKPATIWNEALPLGNGRLGAMVYGKTGSEIIQFNEETLWTGQPHDYAREGAHEYLDELRRLLWEGKQGEAHNLGNRHFMSQPTGQLSYQPFGNILLSFPEHENVDNYQRRLDLQNAISSVFYEADGIQFKREVFASAPDQAIVVRLESSQNGALNFTAGLDSPHSGYEVSVDGDHAYVLLKNLVIPSNVYERYSSDDGGIYMNMFCACPPFQIDGNFGATAGITEMLLQSHLRDINGGFYQDILPALPEKLSSGKITRIKGRGGFELSIKWEEGELTDLQVRSILGNNLNLRYKGKALSMETSAGEVVRIGKRDFQ